MRKDISAIIKEWKNEACVEGIILVSKYYTKGVLKICTDRPGIMIGPRGVTIDKYLKKLQEVCPEIKEIEFIETDSWFIR